MLGEITSSILISLVEKSVFEGSERLWNAFKNTVFSERDELGTMFYDSLEKELRKQATLNNDEDLMAVAQNLDFIVQELEGKDLLFENETHVVDELIETIQTITEYDMNANSTLREGLQTAIIDSYRQLWNGFIELTEDSEFAQQLSVEASVTTLSITKEINRKLMSIEQQLEHLKFYRIFGTFDDEVHRAQQFVLQQGGVEIFLEFVTRSELDEPLASPRYLITGRKGTGKSRALIELIQRGVYEFPIKHIIIIERALTRTEELVPVLRERYDGNVLLVWDDIHDIDPQSQNAVFREAIRKLEAVLSATGFELYVLATSRSEDLNTLLNYDRPDDQVWKSFSTIKLLPLDKESVATFIGRALCHFDIVASEKVQDAFAERVVDVDPSPFYILSVISFVVAEGRQRLTESDLAHLPKEALTIWRAQFTEIQREPGLREVLWALKILSELNTPYYRQLIYSMYKHIFDGDIHQFDIHVRELVRRQWIYTIDEAVDNDLEVYLIHDIQIEAVTFPIEAHFHTISNFILSGDLETPSEVEEDVRIRLNHGALLLFGQFYNEQGEPFNDQTAHLLAHHIQTLADITEDADFLTTYAEYNYRYSEEKDPDISKAYLDRALQRDENHPEAHQLYATIFVDEGDMSKAETYIQQAIDGYATRVKEDPTNGDYRFEFAEMLAMDEQSFAAAREYNSAISIQPDDESYRIGYAEYLITQKNYRLAEEHLEKALEISDESAEAHALFGLALILHEENETDLASVHFQRALSLAPDEEELHTNIAFVLFEEGYPEEGKKQLIRYIELTKNTTTEIDESSFEVIFTPGYMEHRSEEDTERLFEQSIESSPDDASLYSAYGIFLSETGHDDRAEDVFKRAIELDHLDLEINRNYAVFLTRNDRHNEAEEYFNAALDIDPSDQHTHHMYAGMLMNEDRFEEAEGVFKNALELAPTAPTNSALELNPTARIYKDYALLLNRLDRIPEAIDSIKIALEIEPDNPEIIADYAILLYKGNRPLSAEKQYKRILEFRPGDVKTLFSISLLAAKGGRYDSAALYLEEALCIEPGDSGMTRLYGTLVADDPAKYETLERYYRAAVENNPDDFTFYATLGSILHMNEKFEESERAYLTALDQVPEADWNDGFLQTQNIKLYYALLLADMERSNDADEIFSALLTEEPENPILHTHYAIFLAYTDQWEEAVQYFHSATGFSNEDAEALGIRYYNYAVASAIDEEQERALSYYERALEANPESTLMRNGMACTLAELSNDSDAEQEFERSIRESEPDNPFMASIYNNYATFLGDRKRLSQARAHLEKAREFSPENETILRNFDRIDAGRESSTVGNSRSNAPQRTSDSNSEEFDYILSFLSEEGGVYFPDLPDDG